jgi:hypothetical protein
MLCAVPIRVKRNLFILPNAPGWIVPRLASFAAALVGWVLDKVKYVCGVRFECVEE